MGLGTGATAAIIGGIGAAGSVASSAIGAHAAGSAADKQRSANQPYTDAGYADLAKLQEGLNNGTFGPGSIPAFKAPTLDEARNTPGYQFALEQGNKGILQGSAAMGGAISGGTLKSLAQYDTGLADTTYGDVFSRAMQTYQASLQGQNQAYQQLLTPTELGQSSAVNTGNAGAAGDVGTANAVNSGIGGLTSTIQQSSLLSLLLKNGGLGANQNSQAPTPTLATAANLGMSQPLASTPMPPIQIPLTPAGIGPG